MKPTDVVTELNEWLASEASRRKHADEVDVDTGLLERAREEIVALRDQLDVARAEALEEAALVCERYCDSPVIVQIAGEQAAAMIRALKMWSLPRR